MLTVHFKLSPTDVRLVRLSQYRSGRVALLRLNVTWDILQTPLCHGYGNCSIQKSVTICVLSKIEHVRDVSLCLLHASTQGRLWSIIRDSLDPLWMRISVFAGSAMLTLFNYWIVCVRGMLAGAFVYWSGVYTASPQQNNLLASHSSLIIWMKFLNGFS